MHTNKIGLCMAMLFVIPVLLMGLTTSVANAEEVVIDQTDLNAQENVVTAQAIDLLESQLKLIQMLYLKHLQERVALLQTYADAQS